MIDPNNAIFEPDVVLSAELLTPTDGPRTPERALLLSALEDAVRCVFRTCTAKDERNRALYDETMDWFASTEHARLFDFENLCNVFGLEPTYVRKHVFARCEQLRAGLPPAPTSAPLDASVGDDEPERLRA